jgi:hypothetical protein
MSYKESHKGLSRRDLLKRSTAAGVSFMIGSGFFAANNAAWAMETKALKPETMATLVQMARDIYPHDQVGDEYYAVAVKGYDSADAAPGIEAGVAKLNAAAQAAGHDSYLAMGWERDRVDILRGMKDDGFFQQIRGGLVTGLYNQKAIWPIFGYEGASFEFGGYIERGFNDVNWI